MTTYCSSFSDSDPTWVTLFMTQSLAPMVLFHYGATLHVLGTRLFTLVLKCLKCYPALRNAKNVPLDDLDLYGCDTVIRKHDRRVELARRKCEDICTSRDHSDTVFRLCDHKVVQ